MIIHILNEQDSIKISSEQVEKLVLQVLEAENCTCDEVSVTFVDTKRICALHEEFFQDDSPTDCISFPMDMEDDETYRVLGEIFVCPQAALDYNPKHPYEETTLYIIHGLLHLLGYDDIDRKKRALMRNEEKRLMKLAKKHKCILQPS